MQKNKGNENNIKFTLIKLGSFICIFLLIFAYRQREAENQTFELTNTAYLYEGNQLVGINTGEKADELAKQHVERANQVAKEVDKNLDNVLLTTSVVSTPSIINFDVAADEQSEVIKYVSEHTKVLEKGYTLSIDDKYKFYVKDRKSIEWVIEKILLAYLPDKSYLDYYQRMGEFKPYTDGEKTFTGIDIANDVTITEGYVAGSEYIDDEQELLHKLFHKDQEKSYEHITNTSNIKSIKKENNLTDTVFELNNPNLTNEAVTYNGQQVITTEIDPLINVVQTFETKKTENLDFETVKKTDDLMLTGQFKVKTEGKEGKKEITYENKIVNGEVISTEKKSEEVVQAPEHKVVIVGAAPVANAVTVGGNINGDIDVSSSNAAATASGFIWPSSSRTVTCPYGCYAGHSGIDIQSYTGGPEYAAKAGVVVTSGWSNYGYGYHVVIDHGNGVKTLYAHQPSQPPVAVGEYVEQGQVIGFEGQTGNATGHHLHFEIQINGTAVNPYPYIS